MGLGYGLSSWGYGSSLYGMGYMPYSNPYYGYGGTNVVATNPSRPRPTTTRSRSTRPPLPWRSRPPIRPCSTFDAARQLFQQGNYEQALTQADQALKTLSGDTALHEFRALCQFALARYDDAAATLYAVLSVGPGWDWATMVGLYPDSGVYTAQLRSLEAYCQANPTSAPARFVLAYHYLVQGHTEAAVSVLKQVVALMPKDALSAKLLRQLEPPPAQASATEANAEAEPPAPPADATPPAGALIAGAWKATPTADTTVALSIQPDGGFTWQVDQKGKTQQFAGTLTFGEGILTMVQEKGPVMVGRVSWQDANHMTFRVVGDGPEDPGLSFSR